MLLSCVVPCYNETQTIEELHRRLSTACRSTGDHDYEIIFINDGSEDGTWRLIERICETDQHVVGIDLARNHGHQLALTAGLETARGDIVFMLDADLQHPPEVLGEMLAVMDKEKSDVVYGRRRKKRDDISLFKRYSATVFYRVLDYLSDTKIPRDAGDFRLVHRRVVDVLNQMPERHRFIRGMIAWLGFKQVPFDYDVAPRFAGETKYSLSKMAALAADAFTGFSIAPLRLASVIGALSGLIGILLLIYTLVAYAFLDTVHGWASILGAILLFGSIQMFFLGIVGEYLGRLFIQSKNRPLYVIRQIRRPERPVAQKASIIAAISTRQRGDADPSTLPQRRDQDSDTGPGSTMIQSK
jgi:polyisoprenyl-phosphate glycosyltransferase